MNDRKLDDEPGRLAALDRLGILDTPPEAGFDEITRLVQDILAVPISLVSLVDRDRQWFKSRQGLAAVETPRAQSFCAHTILGRSPLIVPDATRDARFSSNPLVTGNPLIRSYAGVPLCTTEGYNLGALCAIDTRPRNFTAKHIDMLQRFAALVVNEIELRTIARSDFLTGAATRRAFTAAAEDEIEHCRRYGRTSSLLLLDLDHFKFINDSFGHSAGDDVLKAVAHCCQNTLRPGDRFGRLGGEEFAILLHEIDAAGAFATAERLRRQISALQFPWVEETSITASFGAAALDVDQSWSAWLESADRALYEAKRRGRNRTFIGKSLVPANVAA